MPVIKNGYVYPMEGPAWELNFCPRSSSARTSPFAAAACEEVGHVDPLCSA